MPTNRPSENLVNTLQSISDDRTGRAFDVHQLASFQDELPIPAGTRNFVLLLAANEVTHDRDVEAAWIARCLDRGMVYLCTWGDAASVLHDLTDEIDVQREIDSGIDRTTMTTDHTGESLDDAVFFFVDVAWPPEPPCDTWIAAAVGQIDASPLVEGIRRVLSRARA